VTLAAPRRERCSVVLDGDFAMSDAHLVATPSVSSYPLDDELVLYTPTDGQAYILNRTAARVWRLLDGTRTEETLARELADTYGEEYEQVLVDVRELVAHLQSVGLLLVQPNVTLHPNGQTNGVEPTGS
jgi:hypothetical protein